LGKDGGQAFLSTWKLRVKAQERSWDSPLGLGYVRSLGAGPLCTLASPSLLGVGPGNYQFPDTALLAFVFARGAAAKKGVPVKAVEMSLAALALDVCDAGLFGVF
jgi:hypothetical protein